MTDMKHVRQLVPSAETLQLWADELILGDVWYWDDSPLDLDLTGCQVMTSETYRSDPTYHNIRYMNAYCEWLMPAEATRVIVSDQAWIGSSICHRSATSAPEAGGVETRTRVFYCFIWRTSFAA